MVRDSICLGLLVVMATYCVTATAATRAAHEESKHTTARPQHSEDTHSEDTWSGTYQVVPSEGNQPPESKFTIVRTDQGYQLREMFSDLRFAETTPGVLTSPTNETAKLFLAEATFADGQKIRVIRAELGQMKFLMIARPSPKHAADNSTLVINEETNKSEVAESMVGFADTQIFYRLPEQKVVVRIKIGNNGEFPIKATVHVFPDDSTADGINAWINNQHSDGLFPETAEPSHSEDIPMESCTISNAKLLKRSQEPFGAFKQYEVTFEIAECENVGGYEVHPFRDTARVYVKE